MKTSIYAYASIFVAFCLCGCEHDGGGDPPSAMVAIVAVPEAYATTSVPGYGYINYMLEVTVQSNSGLPLAGAWVQVMAEDCYGNGIQQVNTDAWGRAFFYFCVPPGSWVYLDADSTGFAPAAVDLATGGNPYLAVPVYLAPLVVVM